MSFLDRTSRDPTPTSLKVAIWAQGFFFLIGSGLKGPLHVGALFALPLTCAEFVVLVALWNLRRWAFYGLQVLLAVYIATHVGLPLVAWRGVVAGAIFRNVALAAAFFHRKRLT